MSGPTLDLQKLKKEFIAGGIGGSIGVFIGFPMDLVKVKIQLYPEMYTSSFACLKSIVQLNGFRSLYHGVVPPILTKAVLNAMLFAGESIAMQVLEPNLKRNHAGSHLHSFIAGSCGGLAQSVLLVPTDVVKCSMQAYGASTGPPKGFIREMAHTIKLIYAEHGIRGFYRGYFATIVRDIPAMGIYFFTYKNIREQIVTYQNRNKVRTWWDWLFRKREKPSNFATLMAGGTAGAVSWVATYPLDVIKTHMQISVKPIEPDKFAYKDMPLRHVANSLYRRHGGRIFVNGMGITILRAFPVNATVFLVYEKISELIE